MDMLQNNLRIESENTNETRMVMSFVEAGLFIIFSLVLYIFFKFSIIKRFFFKEYTKTTLCCLPTVFRKKYIVKTIKS